MRLPVSVVVTAVAMLLAVAGHGGARSNRSSAAQPGDLGRDGDLPASEPDVTFLYDAATRFNERLLGNIDAIDTATTAVLAGDVAVLVFAIDKILEVQRAAEQWALALLCISLLLCVIGYALGFPYHFSSRDGVRPRSFIPDAFRRSRAATLGAIHDQMEAVETNLSIRFAKRWLAVAAILFLLGGGAVIIVARLRGAVIY